MIKIYRNKVEEAITYLGSEMNRIINEDNIRYIKDEDEYADYYSTLEVQKKFWKARLPIVIKLEAFEIATEGGESDGSVLKQYCIGHIVYQNEQVLYDHIFEKALEKCRYKLY